MRPTSSRERPHAPHRTRCSTIDLFDRSAGPSISEGCHLRPRQVSIEAVTRTQIRTTTGRLRHLWRSHQLSRRRVHLDSAFLVKLDVYKTSSVAVGKEILRTGWHDLEQRSVDDWREWARSQKLSVGEGSGRRWRAGRRVARGLVCLYEIFRISACMRWLSFVSCSKEREQALGDHSRPRLGSSGPRVCLSSRPDGRGTGPRARTPRAVELTDPHRTYLCEGCKARARQARLKCQLQLLVWSRRVLSDLEGRGRGKGSGEAGGELASVPLSSSWLPPSTSSTDAFSVCSHYLLLLSS